MKNSFYYFEGEARQYQMHMIQNKKLHLKYVTVKHDYSYEFALEFHTKLHQENINMPELVHKTCIKAQH